MRKIYIYEGRPESIDIVPSSWFILNIKTTIVIKTCKELIEIKKIQIRH